VFEHVEHSQEDFQPDMPQSWLQLMKNLYPGRDFDGNWPDFEDLVTVLDEWERSCQDYEGPRQGRDPYSPAHLKDVLLRHLRHLLCEQTTVALPEAMGLVKRFAAGCAANGDVVVSFNWDFLLEVACRQEGIGVSYGGNAADGLQVAKPHGSLNLAQMKQEKWGEVRGASNVRDVFIDHEAEGMVVVRAENPADALSRTVNPFPFSLVEPTARKVYESPWLRLQWARALEMFRQAEEIIVIGYSLPFQDFRPRVLFQAGTIERQPRIHIVDPNAQDVVSKNYAPYVCARIEPISSPWQDWLR
jgi:hypothetical protein